MEQHSTALETRPHSVSQMTQGLLISYSREVLYVTFGTDSDFTSAVWWWRWLLRLRTRGRNWNRRNHPHYPHCNAFQWAVADVDASASILIALLGCPNSDGRYVPPDIVIDRLNGSPSFTGLAIDERFARLALRVKGIEVLIQSFLGCIGEIDGVRLLTRETMERARESQNERLGAPASLMPLVGQGPQRFGLGFELPRAIEPILGAGSFGHAGAGGRHGVRASGTRHCSGLRMQQHVVGRL